MKIVRFGMQMQETLGLLDDQNKVRSLKGVFDLSNNDSIGDQVLLKNLIRLILILFRSWTQM